MTNLLSFKNNIANTQQDSNKRRSHSKFSSTINILENSDFKKFLDLYLNNETEFFERIDGYDGFISTQQLESVNYENFEEHVFFDSAVEKVNYAFSKAINEFPYDQTKYQASQYLKKLDGFSRYVLKEKVFKSKNYINFSGSNIITLEDKRGYLLDDYLGNSFVNNFDPNEKSFSFDFWIYPINSQNVTKKTCLFKKFSNSCGYLITIDFSEGLDLCDINFLIVEGTNFFKASYKIKCNVFQHVCFEIYNEITENATQENNKNFRLVIDGKEINKNYSLLTTQGSVQSLSLNFSQISQSFSESNVFIGGTNNSTIIFDSENLDNINIDGGFEGLLDEFKFFSGSKRKLEDIVKFKDENINSSDELILYFKFNEPSGRYSNNNIIIDYSGNKMHGIISEILDYNNIVIQNVQNFDRNGIYQDNNVNIETPLKYENLERNPVMFSSISQASKEEMLEKAAEYDLINPNSFWKLFPKNIFLEGSDYDNIKETYISSSTKKSTSVLGTEKSINQEIIKLISIWARFFDQIKMYIDSFTEILNFNYDTINNGKKIDGMILPLALNQAGFKFREIQAFSIQEKLENKNLTHEEVMSVLSIRQIQNILWKRFLLNSKDYLMSKGTKKSIKSVFNSFGLEANKYISIKEVNGQNRFNINNQFIEDRVRIKFIDFNRHDKVYLEDQFSGNLVTNKLSLLTNLFYKDSANPLTMDLEKDWSLEFYFRFDKTKNKMFLNNQSLLRIDHIEGDEQNFSVPFLNVVFNRTNNSKLSGELKTFILHNGIPYSNSLDNVSLMNGCLYHYCIRKTKNKTTKNFEYYITLSPTGSLSYTTKKENIIKTSSIQYVNNAGTTHKYRIAIGSYKYQDVISESEIDNFSYETNFQGMITHLRLYNCFITNESLSIKSKDLKYIGNDTKNFSSRELKLNLNLTRPVESYYQTANNKFDIFNYTSLENLRTNLNIIPSVYIGQSLLDDQQQIEGNKIFNCEDHIILRQNPEFDVLQNTNKVYINSFENEVYKNQYKNDNITHSSQHHPEYLYHDDQRLYIDFSAVNFLNKDMSNLISVNDYFTNVLSNSSCLFEDSYIDLKNLRDEYFQRIKSKEDIDFSVLYQVYKYFDNILEDLLYDAIPSRVNYSGFNFVYESHIFERSKYQYKYSDSRIPVSCKEGFEYQNYENQAKKIKYRRDDSINGLGTDAIDLSIIKRNV